MELEELGIREECGVFGCIASGEWPTQLDVPHVITLGLVGLQHRGQESAGIVTSDGNSVPTFKTHKGMFLNHVFTGDNLKKFMFQILELDTRVSLCCETLHGKIAVAHNGELVNAARLRKKLLRHGVGLSTSSDSEMITQLLAYTPPQERDDTPDWVARIKNLMKEAPTAYSLLIMHRDVIYAVRDPYGNRPLCIGRLIPVSDINEKEREMTGLLKVFFLYFPRYYREVLPGEIVEISRHNVRTLDIVSRSEGNPVAFCIFEYVYFARPDSIFEDQMVYTVRYRCGQQLAIEAPVDADLVSTVPESATPAALGYAGKCGLPYVEVRVKTIRRRTFIQPNMRLRQLVLQKIIVLIDDSIVRGNTISPIKIVHIRVASPPIRYPCFMGINIPTKEELIANKPEFDHLAEYLGANSVIYLSVEGLVSSRSGRQDIMIQENEMVWKSLYSLSHWKYPVELEW
uniref:Amidophosphoribosyltransferase n=1 Tax=Microcebus murinus TaxID=30608 RepID=A0A8C6EKR7_MICMU